MQCKNCGAQVGSEYRLCPYCRTELEYSNQNNNTQQPIIIQNVISAPDDVVNAGGGTNAVPNANGTVNTVVGVNVTPSKAVTKTKSKTVALLLCVFLGYFGAHHFYAGKIGMGILYFFTAGLFCFGWIYDIFKILSGTYRDGLGLPIVK